MSNTRDEILEGIANIGWLTAWASAAEERHSEGGSRLYPPGCRIEDYAPDRPRSFDRWASALVTEIERASTANPWPIEDLYGIITGPKDSPKRFGECLAYESLGDGVAWSDDNEPHGLEVPRSETYVFLSRRTGKPVDWQASVGGKVFCRQPVAACVTCWGPANGKGECERCERLTEATSRTGPFPGETT